LEIIDVAYHTSRIGLSIMHTIHLNTDRRPV